MSVKTPFVEIDLKTTLRENDRGNKQIIGLEFFNINHFLRNFLDWSNLQWWALVEVSEESSGLSWELDITNPYGESLMPVSSTLMGILIVFNGKILSVDETRKLYDKLRRREFGWNWYRDNDTSFSEISDAVYRMREQKEVDISIFYKCLNLGLCDQNKLLTSEGVSLIEPQDSADRKNTTFSYGEVYNE